MTYNCTVLIPIRYPEESVFLKRNLIQIDRFKHPEVELEVLVADQTQSQNINNTLAELSLNYVKSFTCAGVDAGWPIDEGVKRASGKYFMSFDVDCAPIHKAWAYLPIYLIDKHQVSAVGKSTGLHMADAYKAFGNFFHINNYYRTMKTDDVKRLSEDVGFMRFENRYKVHFTPRVNTDWNISCDNGVVAQWYSDQINMGPKVSLALNNISGMTNQMGVFGMTIDSLIYHFVFSSSKDWITNKMHTLGENYMMWYTHIYESGYSDKIFDDLIASLKPHHPAENDREISNNGIIRTLTPEDEISKVIERIKSE